MVKRFIMLVILLAGTAFTVLLGEGFNFFNPNPTATTPVVLTPTVEATHTAVFTETAVPTATSELTNTPLATATSEFTATAAATETATATSTSIPTNTPTATATATATPNDDLFAVQAGSPVFTANFAHPEVACNWQGVAGQILSKTGAPLQNYILKITGTYNGNAVNQIGLSGLVDNTPYGPGSFEFVLGTTAVDSADLLTIQVFNPQGTEVMGPFSIDTYAACTKNLQIINFQAK
jgi:hypothetical protein